jgi:hypothetical protein
MSRRRLVSLLLAGLAAIVSLPAAGQPQKIPSQIVERQVKKLTHKVHWYDSLKEAREKAKKENKLVLWLHALGDLDGTT